MTDDLVFGWDPGYYLNSVNYAQLPTAAPYIAQELRRLFPGFRLEQLSPAQAGAVISAAAADAGDFTAFINGYGKVDTQDAQVQQQAAAFGLASPLTPTGKASGLLPLAAVAALLLLWRR